MNRLMRRRIVDRCANVVALLAVAVAALPLFSVLWEVAKKGVPVMSWEFLTATSTGPVGAGGGILHAIVGTGIVVLIGTAIGAPIAIITAIYLFENRKAPLARAVRLTVDVMSGIPSIVAGLFGFALIVTRFGFSAWAGGVALALILLPVVTRTTEEALRTVPITYREAALGMGASQWYTMFFVILPAARGPILTGLLLGVARIAGETAPLLLTVLTSFYLVTSPGEPIATLPYLVYDYGKSAFPKLQDQAWGAAFVLLMMVLGINLVVRALARRSRTASV